MIRKTYKVSCLFVISILAPATIPAYAQQLKIGFSLLNVSYTNSDVKREPYENWQENYRPHGGSMTTDRHNFALSWDLGLVSALIVGGKKLSLGIPIYYYITFVSIPSYYDNDGEKFSGRDYLTIDKTIAGITVDWWNTVPLHKVRLRKTSPAIGFFVKWGIIKSRLIKFQGTVQKYSIISEDYAGIDRFGNVNTARVINRKTIEDGLGWRFDVHFMTEESKWMLGIYYERNGIRVNQVGLSLLRRIDVLEF